MTLKDLAITGILALLVIAVIMSSKNIETVQPAEVPVFKSQELSLIEICRTNFLFYNQENNSWECK